MPKSKPKSTSRPKLLSHTRPPLSSATTNSPSTNAPTSKPSSKHTRTTIRTYHTLQKRLSHALATNDHALAQTLQSQLTALGGLKTYQLASTTGQSSSRGGDTSRVLIEWLAPLLQSPTSGTRRPATGNAQQARPLRILEVGALSASNALARPRETAVRRIDLRSNDPLIEEQDLMTLSPSVPWEGEVGYDVVSLSLVVNFVGDAAGRGRMLEWTTQFLRGRDEEEENGVEEGEEERLLLPALFLVLPLPCVENSRYLNEERLREIMASLGYEELYVKKSSKLYYSIWRFNQAKRTELERKGRTTFKKTELRSGKDRNNFCIVLENPG